MHPDIDNAYAELGLSPGATEAEVKAAWRRLVSRWHPDRNPGAAALARMQRINHSFEAIRAAGFGPSRADGPDAAAASPATVRTFSRKVRLTLAEAAFGCTKVLRGKPVGACAACAGIGHRVAGGHCPQCKGSGAVRQGAWFGWVGAAVECDACHGSGRAQQACQDCGGSGRSSTPAYTATVRFPQGVRQGDVLGVRLGADRASEPPVELALRIEVQPHAQLSLDADGTLRCEMPVDGFAWIAERTVDVPTLDGLQPLALRRHQLVHCLVGQGFPIERRGPRGDLLVSVVPVFPEHLSADQQILLDQLLATTAGPSARQPAPEPLRAWRQALRPSARRRQRAA